MTEAQAKHGMVNAVDFKSESDLMFAGMHHHCLTVHFLRFGCLISLFLSILLYLCYNNASY